MSRIGGGRNGNITIILLIVISSLQAQPGSCLTNKFYVHILNRMSSNDPPLRIHVRSGDDDFGEAVLAPGASYPFHFRLNMWKTTRFYCTFSHGNRSKRFDIFVDGGHLTEVWVCEKSGNVFWKVQDDGFYRSCHDDQSYEKRLDW